MIAALIITLRETLEATLVTSIVFGYLKKTKQEQYKKYVWAGIVSAIMVSLLGAWVFTAIAGGFQGRSEELFEGVTMLVGAALLTTMILWMLRQKGRIGALKERISSTVDNAKRAELFGLVFFSVLREGIETVIFLNAVLIASEGHAVLGGALGIGIALLLGYALYKESLKLNIKKFFAISGVILILFAAGLVAHGIHEFQEAGVIPVVAEHIWDINPVVEEEGVYPVMHENGAIGGILKGLFGYNGNPNLLEVLGYVLYLGVIVGVYKKIDKTKK
ncbi:MAG: high-affinity iron transporter [Candidatus Magasanikbacteria bacterium CG10_big_fil_rev_8_21_14_0_10_43_6]|uniref:High-affinity iron transporter n=1 Tax=Candidatus Magasanikbacteria bacterium CG10_big_fil_rev_8_21_14_0_10_43_6 TaxID=1974650 RepID=A0A2M6W157_9BACT|nr:MAG: high-affinity iron transporter [Candidatus Magasanikbacteria bacterium CG10_big_fil_rev_8_21_14_0_10_43_6]